MSVVEQLLVAGDVDVVMAEAVGSCTDLQAIVVRPLRKYPATSSPSPLTSGRRLGLGLAVATAIGGVILGGLGVAAGTLASDDFAGSSWIVLVAVCYGLFFSLMGGPAVHRRIRRGTR
jgi:hypothetical protein